MSRTDVWYMVHRRASDASIETAIGCHIVPRDRDYGTPLMVDASKWRQRMAGHSNAKTTGLRPA
jgi:integrase/recombinase XerD